MRFGDLWQGKLVLPSDVSGNPADKHELTLIVVLPAGIYE